MPLMHADGLPGEVRVGGRRAAGLLNCSLRPAQAGEWVIRATLVDPVDIYLTADRPVEVRLFISKTVWRWRGVKIIERQGPGVTLAVEGDSESFRLEEGGA